MFIDWWGRGVQSAARTLPKKYDKNGVIWCNPSVPKYVITNLKINNFKDNKSTTTTIMCRNSQDVQVNT